MDDARVRTRRDRGGGRRAGCRASRKAATRDLGWWQWSLDCGSDRLALRPQPVLAPALIKTNDAPARRIDIRNEFGRRHRDLGCDPPRTRVRSRRCSLGATNGSRPRGRSRLLVCLAFLSRAVWRLRRSQAAWPDAETQLGRVLVAPNEGPAVIGVLRPRVVVPAWALTTDHATLELLLRHELEHVRAGDSRVLFAAALLLALFPWNAALCGWRAGSVSGSRSTAIRVSSARSAPRCTHTGSCCRGRRTLRRGRTATDGRRFVRTGNTSRGEDHSHDHATSSPRARRVTSVWRHRGRRTFDRGVDAAPRRHSLETAANQSSGKETAGAATTAAAKSEATPKPSSIPAPPPPAARRSPPPFAAARSKPLRGIRAAIPDDLRMAGTEGTVIARFSVDPRGIPDTTTIHVIESTNDKFSAAVRSVLPGWRFDTAGSVSLPFRFILTSTVEREQDQFTQMVIDGVARYPVVIAALGPPASRQQRVGIPDTPVGRAFKAWVDATNSGDRALLDAFNTRVYPSRVVADDGRLASRERRRSADADPREQDAQSRVRGRREHQRPGPRRLYGGQ